MLIIGLTGSIAMGKSMTARQLRQLGIPVHDSDRSVHKFLAPKGRAFAAVAKAFPEAVQKGNIDRAKLGQIVFANAKKLKKLEAILHPLVFDETRRWVARQNMKHRKIVVLDIPLLYEVGRDRICDVVMVASAPAFLQRQRALARPGMTAARLDAILAKQIPDAEKRRRADVIIPTGLGKAVSQRALQKALITLSRKQGRKWAPGWK